MNDTGGNAPPGNAYAGNGYAGTDLEGNQNDSNYSVQRIRIGTKVAPRPDGAVPTISIQGTQIFFTGKLQGTDSLKNAFSDVPMRRARIRFLRGPRSSSTAPRTERLNRD
ncbi:MAG: hypothetical protein U1G08_06730 [Verrucomicrobiota bacterium]